MEYEEIIKKVVSISIINFKDDESWDINGEELYEELISLKIIIKDKKQPEELLKYLYKHSLENSFPNV